MPWQPQIAAGISVGILLSACAPSSAPVVSAAAVSVASLQPAVDSPAAVVDHPADLPMAVTSPPKVRVRQDGHDLPVQDHEAVVARRPFELVVDLQPEPRELLMHASFKPFWYDQVRGGVPLNKLEVLGPGRGMAEGQPPDPELILSEEGIHFLYWTTDSDHRCHALERSGNGLGCVRRVERIIPVPGAAALPLERVTQRVLFVSFMKVRPGASIEQPVEVSRDWLRIELR